MINEAVDLVQNGVASPEDIDTAMRLGCNHPMGPWTLADFIGLDICLAIMDTIYEETHDSKYRASLLLRKMVRAGKLGNKSGEGLLQALSSHPYFCMVSFSKASSYINKSLGGTDPWILICLKKNSSSSRCSAASLRTRSSPWPRRWTRKSASLRKP